MAGLIAQIISVSLSNFPLTFLLIGLLASAIVIARAPAPRSTALIVEKLISWHVFFALGVTHLDTPSPHPEEARSAWAHSHAPYSKDGQQHDWFPSFETRPCRPLLRMRSFVSHHSRKDSTRPIR